MSEKHAIVDPAPKFPIGTRVRISKPESAYFLQTGTVAGVFIDEKTGVPSVVVNGGLWSAHYFTTDIAPEFG